MHTDPANGDVLITTRDGAHYLSIVPHPDRMCFKELERAITIAKLWASAQNVEIWRACDGKVDNLRNDPAA